MDEEGQSGLHYCIPCQNWYDTEQPRSRTRPVDGSVSATLSIRLSSLLITAGSSHPESKKYGQYYSAEDVAELFAPSQSTVDAVRSWLESAGIAADSVSQSANKQWMQFDASISDLESLLLAEYHEYEHTETGKTTIACDK